MISAGIPEETSQVILEWSLGRAFEGIFVGLFKNMRNCMVKLRNKSLSETPQEIPRINPEEIMKNSQGYIWSNPWKKIKKNRS